MAKNKPNSSGEGRTWEVGIRSDVYERTLEITWMTRDDIETLESRLEDKGLFQNIALITWSASIPLGIEKFIDYRANGNANELAIFIVCLVAALVGVIAQFVANSRKKKAETFKTRLFHEDRLVQRKFAMFDTGSDTR